MTNRQMIMLKLIQLSDEEFAAFMDNEITVLMDGGLCQVCMEKHDGQCPMDKGFAQFWSNNVKVFSYIWYLIIESISSCRNHKHRLCDFFKQSLISWR